MSISAEDLKNHAEELLSQNGSEVVWRNAAGRAYYSIFHTAKHLAWRLGLPKNELQTGSHLEIFNKLAATTSIHSKQHIEVKKIAYRARSVFKPLRTHADYELDKPFEKHHAQAMLNDAIDIIAKEKTIT